MKQRKNISKIALLAGLLMLNTTANSFYQCVPKKDWKRIVYLTPKSKQKEFKQLLESGKYKVTAAGGGGEQIIKEFTLIKISEFKACAGKKGEKGNGGGGNGYNGEFHGYDGIRDAGIDDGYGAGERGNSKDIHGSGCHGGDGIYTSGIIGGSGSYFSVGNVELVLKGGNLTNYDGYVIIERWE